MLGVDERQKELCLLAIRSSSGVWAFLEALLLGVFDSISPMFMIPVGILVCIIDRRFAINAITLQSIYGNDSCD